MTKNFVIGNIPFIGGILGKVFSSSTGSISVTETTPLDLKYIGDTIAQVTNGDDDTYNYYVNMDGYTMATFQLILNGGSGTVTVKVYGTTQDDGTAPASCTYEDIGSDTFGSVSWTASDILADNAKKLAGYKYVKIEVVVDTTGADDADWTIFSKRIWA